MDYESKSGYINIKFFKGTETEVTVPERVGKINVLTINDHAFSPIRKRISASDRDVMRKIVSVSMPEGIREIGDSAFEFCESIERINIPASVVSIGKKAFTDCPKAVIHAPKDSFAIKLAKKRKINFVEE